MGFKLRLHSTGASGGFFPSDRSTSGQAGLYRSGGINRLWDSTAGDVIFYNGSGQVGIGASPGAYKLDVAGTMHVSGAVTFDGAVSLNGGVTFGNSSISYAGDNDRLNFVGGTTYNAGSYLFSSQSQLAYPSAAGNGNGGLYATAGSIDLKAQTLTWAAGAVNVLGGEIFLEGGKSPNGAQVAGNVIINGATGGNVGIGTTNPITKFDVNGGAISIVGGSQNSTNGFTGVSTEIGYDTTAGVGFLQSANWGTSWSNLTLQPGGGNVGIGSSTPTQTLDVNGTIKAGAYALLSTSGTAGYYQDATNGAYRAIVGSGTTTGYYFQSNAGGGTSMYVGLGGSYNGRVGVNTTTPAYALDVSGTAHFSGTTRFGNSSAAQFEDQTTFQRLAFTELHFWDWDTGADMVTFNNGNVGVGTTTPIRALTVGNGGELSLIKNGGGVGYINVSDAAGSNSGSLDIRGLGSAGGAEVPLSLVTLNTNTTYITGNLGLGTGSPGYKLDVSGTTRTSGEFISTQSGSQFRGISGNYGWFHYADGTTYYILLTNSADQYGSYNGLRPFAISLSTGAVSMNNGVTIAGGLATNSITVSGAATFNGTTTITGAFNTAKMQTTGNNTINTADAHAADIVIGSDAGTRHNSSMMMWTNGGAFRIAADDTGGSHLLISDWNTATAGVSLAAATSGTSYLLGNVGIGTAAPHARFEINSGTGDGIVMYQPSDNLHSIQSYIDGHWSDRSTYGGPCCNQLNIETDAGNVVIGNGLANGGITLAGPTTITGVATFNSTASFPSLTINGVSIVGTPGRNYFKDSELSSGTGLRVGAVWGMYGTYAENGPLGLGGATGINFQNSSGVVTSGGYFGMGTAGPASRVTVSGGGQGTVSFNTAGSLANVLELDDTGTGAGAGGVILFSAGTQAWKFATIQGFVTDGGNNTRGDITFSTRRVNTDGTLTEAMRIRNDGHLWLASSAGNYDQMGMMNSNEFGIQPYTYFHIMKGSANTGRWFNGGSDDMMKIDYNNVYFPQGNVGIGPATPGSKLWVQGGGYAVTGQANGSAYAIGANSMAVDTSFYSYGSICTGNANGNCSGASGVVMGTSNTGATVNIPNSGTVFFNGGNVGIGGTGASAKLEINNTANQPALSVGDSGTDNGTAYGMVNLTRAADTTRAHLALIRAGNYVWQFGYVNGTNTMGIFPWNFSGSQGTPTMAFSGGSVGIGTASPGAALHLYGTAGIVEKLQVNGGGPWIQQYCDPTNCIRNWMNSGELVMQDAGSNIIMTLKQGGNVNFGNNLTFSGANPYLTSASSYIVIPNGLYVSGGTPYFQNQIQARGGVHNDSGVLSIDGGTSGYTNVTGNLGIGTTAPALKLDVQGNAVFGVSAFQNGAVVSIGNTSTNYSGWNTNLLLSGYDYSGVSFHDSSCCVGEIQYHDHTISMDGAGSWGPIGVGINTTNTAGNALWVEGSGVINTNIGNANAANVNAFSITGTQYAAGSGNFNTLAVFPTYNNGGSYSGITGVLATPYVQSGTLTSGVTGVYATPTMTGGNISSGANVTGLMAHPTNSGSSISGGIIGVEGITYGSGYIYGTSMGGAFGCSGYGALCYGLFVGDYGGSGYGTRYALYVQDQHFSVFNGRLAVGANIDYGYALNVSGGGYSNNAMYVSGYAYSTWGYWGTSDARLKKNIVTVTGALDKISKMRGVYFDWNKTVHPNMNLSDRHQLGVIAQETEKVFPEAVTTDAKGFKAVDYNMLVSPLIEAVKELNAKFKKLAASLKELGITIEKGITRIASLAVDALTVGSDEKPSGITMYDEDTKQPYCVKIKAGRMINMARACAR